VRDFELLRAYILVRESRLVEVCRLVGAAEQIHDAHIISTGSLELLDSGAELLLPILELNNDCNVRENPLIFESDMYTPH
jgi:hypothetical protein